MGASSIRRAQGRDRAGKRAGRRPRGLQAVAIDGTWHAYGTVRAGGRSIRVRQSLGLSADRYTQDQADDAARDLETETRDRAQGKSGRGAALGIAALAYLTAPRERPLKPSSRRIVKQIVAQFGERRGNEIRDAEWFAWIDGDPARKIAGIMAGNKPQTRERFLNTVVAFLNYCTTQHGLARLPAFRRDRKSTTPNRRAKRRVAELRIELIEILLNHAHPTHRAQIAVEVVTGARVSSVLHGARLCDLDLTPGRETIVFRGTKSGRDVPAALSPGAASELRRYLTWRGKLHDREAALFLTPKRKPYADNGGVYGAQNRNGFNNAKARAVRSIRILGSSIAGRLRHVDRTAAAAAIAAARSDADLLGKVTQHWFRHRMARLWLRKDPRAAMEQGGWLTIQSLMGYTDDVPEFRRQVAAELDAFTPRRPAG